jgi:glycosyltransferase involved in cell wall biosynthesis
VFNTLPTNFWEVAHNISYQHKTKGNFNILMVASLKAYKGLNEFMAIAHRLQSIDSIKMILILSATEQEISSYFKGNEIPLNVELISSQNNMIPFYEKASLLLNLSRVDGWIETFGLTILEAMAFGIPVIVPPVGGPAELVTHDIEGYLINSYNTDEIADTILELSNNKAKCLDLSANAKKKAMTFNEDDFSKQILKIINA